MKKYLFTIIIFGAVLCFVQPTQVSASVITVVDFDGLDASTGFVSGSALDDYLLGFGITISNVLGPSGPFVADATTAMGGFGIPDFFTLPSSPNYLWHQVSNDPISYQLNFSTPLDSLSFTKPQTNAYMSPSGHVVAPWSARVLDSGGNTIGTVGEGWVSSYGIIPEATYEFNVSGIAALVVERTVTNTYAGQSSVAIDNLVLTAPDPVPEPATMLLLGSGLIGLAGFMRKRKK